MLSFVKIVVFLIVASFEKFPVFNIAYDILNIDIAITIKITINIAFFTIFFIFPPITNYVIYYTKFLRKLQDFPVNSIKSSKFLFAHSICKISFANKKKKALVKYQD